MTGCDVWVTAGQSQPAGRGDAALSPATNPTLAFEYRSGLVPLVDPVGDGTVYAAQTGSMWPAFANAITRSSGRPSVIVPCAVGGSVLLPASTSGSNHWGPGGLRFNNAVTRTLNAVAALPGLGYEPTVHITWHQGETDASDYPIPGTLAVDYEAALVDLLDRFRTGLSLPDLDMFVWQLGTRPGYEDEMASIRAAQAAACADTEGMSMVYTRCVDFPDLGWMKSDQLHYTQAGLNDMGTFGGQTIAEALGYEIESPVMALTRTSRTAELLFRIA